MQTKEAVFEPAPDVVYRVNNLFFPRPRPLEQAQVYGTEDTFGTAFGTLLTLTARKTELDSIIEGSVKEERVRRAAIDSAEIELRGGQSYAKRTQTDFPVIRSRVNTLLHKVDPSILPIWVRLLRVVTTPSPNPVTVPLEAKRKEAGNSLNSLQIDVQTASRDQVTLEPEISDTRLKLQQLKNRFLAAWEKIAMSDFKLAGDYVHVYPASAREFSIEYAKGIGYAPRTGQRGVDFERRLARTNPEESKRTHFVENRWIEELADSYLGQWDFRLPL